MNKQEYQEMENNIPATYCVKHEERKVYPRCLMTDEGWECPVCKHIYPYEVH